MPRQPFVYLFGIVLCGPCVAQDLCGLTAPGARGFAPSLDAEDAYSVLDTIGRAVPFRTRTIRLMASSDRLVKQKGGAAAQLCGSGGTERWIFFDPMYIARVKRTASGDGLARYFVLAHEAAHHINGDTLSNSKWDKEEELAADYSAAVWLTRLGVSKNQLLRTFDALGFPAAAEEGYPSLEERRASLIRGCDSASPAPTEISERTPPVRSAQTVDVRFCLNPNGSFGVSQAALMLMNQQTRQQTSIGTLESARPESVQVSISPGNYLIGGFVNGRVQIRPAQISLTSNQSWALAFIVFGDATEPASMDFKPGFCP